MRWRSETLSRIRLENNRRNVYPSTTSTPPTGTVRRNCDHMFTGRRCVIIRGKTASNYVRQAIWIENEKRKKRTGAEVFEHHDYIFSNVFECGEIVISLGTPRAGAVAIRPSTERVAVHRVNKHLTDCFPDDSPCIVCREPIERNRATPRCADRRLWKRHLPRAQLTIINGW
jgi:hypothetical protein